MMRLWLTLVLCFSVAAAILLGTNQSVICAEENVRWHPLWQSLDDFGYLDNASASISGKYIGFFNGDVFRVVTKNQQGDFSELVFDSKQRNRLVWTFGWAGDDLVYCATDGASSFQEIPTDEMHEPDRVTWFEKGQECLALNLKTGEERVILQGAGYPILGDRANGVLAIANKILELQEKSPQGEISFLDMHSGHPVSTLNIGTRFAPPLHFLCWTDQKEIVMLAQKRMKQIIPASELKYPETMLVSIGMDKSVYILASDLLAYDYDGIVRSHSPEKTSDAAICVSNNSCAFFREPSKSNIAVEASVLPLDGKYKERKLLVKKSELPKGIIQPIAVMPDVEGMLFLCRANGSEFGALYYFSFKSRHSAILVKDVEVERMFGNVGSSGILLKLGHRRHSPTMGPDSKVVGIVSSR